MFYIFDNKKEGHIEKREIRTFSQDQDLISERRKQIVNVVSKLFLRLGFRNTNTREICDALGMSKGALYHYIGTKGDLLYMVVKFAMDDQQGLVEIMQKQVSGLTAIESLKKSMRMYFEHVNELQDMYNFINHAIADMTTKDRQIVFDAEEYMVKYFESLLEKGVETGQFKMIDSRLIAHNIVVVANTWANRRWFLKHYYTLPEYIGNQIEHLLAAILSNPIR